MLIQASATTQMAAYCLARREPRIRANAGQAKPHGGFREAEEALRAQPSPVLQSLARACHSLRTAFCLDTYAGL